MPVTIEHRRSVLRAFRQTWIVIVVVLAAGACASRGQGPYWGADATAALGWDRVRSAAFDAATDPFTWVPALGASGLQIGDADNQIAEWANEKTPLFGSHEPAKVTSHALLAASGGAYALTGLFTSAPDGDWVATKTKGFAVGGAATMATAGITVLLKNTVDRNRPLGQNANSFPSGHAGLATMSVLLARHTLGFYDLSRSARVGSDVGLAGLAAMTGWSRIEAGEHHPTDVLAGMALGNFLAVFATKAFLQPVAGESPRLRLGPYGDGMGLGLELRF